ncbi:MAG: type II toxin-antitoxin system ParD family antitoxin [Burkholderiales bacterium]
MDVSLHPDLQAFIDAQVSAGHYQNPSAMINAGLLLLRDHEEMMPSDPAELAELRRQIAIGIEQANRGDFIEFDAAEIKAEGLKLLANQRKP